MTVDRTTFVAVEVLASMRGISPDDVVDEALRELLATPGVRAELIANVGDRSARSDPPIGSRRGGSIQVSTSVPYVTAAALQARAVADDTTLGAVAMAVVRAHAPAIVADVPARPRRAGNTTVRQFVISPGDAQVLANYLDQVPGSERMNVSLLLRHCLQRHLV